MKKLSSRKELINKGKRINQLGFRIGDKITKPMNTEEKTMSEEVKYIPYQKCPKCDGQGTVSKPSWIAGDVYEWSSSATSFQCDVCNGAKIIPMCEIKLNP